MTELIHAMTELINATKGHDAIGMVVLGGILGWAWFISSKKIESAIYAVQKEVKLLDHAFSEVRFEVKENKRHIQEIRQGLINSPMVDMPEIERRHHD